MTFKHESGTRKMFADNCDERVGLAPVEIVFAEAKQKQPVAIRNEINRLGEKPASFVGGIPAGKTNEWSDWRRRNSKRGRRERRRTRCHKRSAAGVRKSSAQPP